MKHRWPINWRGRGLPWNFVLIITFAYMPKHENADRDRAERILKGREFQKNDAAKATADYHADLQRVRDRTEELRRLRLKREAKQPQQSRRVS